MRRNPMLRRALVAVAAGALAAPAAAGAHVTVQPKEIPAGGFTRLNIRVPNERDNADTTKVQVQMPPGFFFVNYEPKPGWKIDVVREKLAKPIVDGDEKITEQVKQVVITSDSEKKGIAPGEFQDFGLSGGPVPDKPGSVLSFPALQTYSNGEVVRWIAKNPEADTPAATVQILKANANGVPVQAAAAPAESSDDGDFASKGLGITALIVGIVGLLAGLAALALSRRRGSGPAA